jgi:hypothetical protein
MRPARDIVELWYGRDHWRHGWLWGLYVGWIAACITLRIMRALSG